VVRVSFSAGSAESFILSVGGAKQQKTISCSKHVATMGAAEASVAAAADLTSVAATTTAVTTVMATTMLMVAAATKQMVSWADNSESLAIAFSVTLEL
jgi:hypothetical protein